MANIGDYRQRYAVEAQANGGGKPMTVAYAADRGQAVQLVRHLRSRRVVAYAAVVERTPRRRVIFKMGVEL